ncbi:MAG: glutamate-1-semialdehyde 2,1-aminomutase [Candidatus Eremiobacteraeota bacterium]|nr:glutamate-1-semialdehyde 2,1-aminomutase [Candidatus Eremiobacteraeota bacterium]
MAQEITSTLHTFRDTSDDALARAQQALAGGVDSPVRAGRPVGGPTPFITRGVGSHVFDANEREYVDYLCAYGPVLLGHADVRIANALKQAMLQGAVFGATHPEEVRLAERIKERFPSIERLRFVSTGTEACMSAVRVARAYTRRRKIIRFEGCYHGHSDAMIFSAGASSLTAPALSAGVTPGVASDIIVLPYNDAQAVERTLRDDAHEVAAIIVEPVCANMGLCLPEPAYLNCLREHSAAAQCLLIFDEVITGLRLARGGAQASYAIAPDLTCIGKALGGGLPIAAFGGRAEVMAMLAPDGPVFVGGTFSGNPACVAAAHALLDALDSDPDFYDRLEELARQLAQGLREIISAAGLGYPVVQCASMVDFMCRTGSPHRNMNQACLADAQAYARYYNAMLERGILLPPSQMELMFLTAAHSEADIEATLSAAQQALR